MKYHDDIMMLDLTEVQVEQLEGIFPNVAPGQSESIDQIRFKSGQVSVVRFIREQFNRQMKSSLVKE